MQQNQTSTEGIPCCANAQDTGWGNSANCQTLALVSVN